MIDNLVKAYSGTYTHDDIFELDVIMVHQMILYAKESAYIQAATNTAMRDAKK